MEEERIDASVGLTLSLRLFERYRRNGILHAPIRRVAGFRGACNAYLRLIEGKVVSCEIEDGSKQRQPVTIPFLARLDHEKGPLEWRLIPTPAVTSPTTQQFMLPSGTVPRAIAPLNLDYLSSWEPRHKIALHMVYSWVDGLRTIEEIKALVSLPPHMVDEACRVLLTLKVIVYQ